MRFREVCDHLLQFEAVRGACSREWQLGDDLVMCVELDMSGYAKIPVSPLHTTPRRTSTPGFLLISFARRVGDQVRIWRDYEGGDGDPLSLQEQEAARMLRVVIRDWVAGVRAELPCSTSTWVGDRMRNGHRPA